MSSKLHLPKSLTSLAYCDMMSAGKFLLCCSARLCLSQVLGPTVRLGGLLQEKLRQSCAPTSFECLIGSYIQGTP